MIMMIHLVLFLLVGVGFEESVAQRCQSDELPCDDGECILKTQWCDRQDDCWDASDEAYCNGEDNCRKDLHFTCKNGRCIPQSALCDQYEDCPDGSDEECDAKTPYKVTETVIRPQMKSQQVPSVKDSVSKAAEYLLRQMNSDDSRDSFTPRAIVALLFASKVSAVAASEQEILKKQLDVNLMLHLLQNQSSQSTLALSINALYATCQDPRNYRGIDLVARLKWDTMTKPNSTLPISLLTLCIADEMLPNEINELSKLYNKKEFVKTTSRALIVMAMICHSRKQKSNIFENFLNDFFTTEMKIHDGSDVYTIALLTQVAIAYGSNVNPEILISKQLDDGSFGDKLSTYLAIPTLLNMSFLDLRCNKSFAGERHKNLIVEKQGKRAILSVWTNTGKEASSHSMTLTFDGSKTLANLMFMASERDPQFRFSADKTDEGMLIYSINNIPNDVESGRLWMLYRGSIGSVIVNSEQNLRLIGQGIDYVDAEDDAHFVFWLRRM